jgi:hypothetical protein
MVRVVFDGAEVRLGPSPSQFGSGLTYFQGLPPYLRGHGYRQRGSGIGDVLRTVWR